MGKLKGIFLSLAAQCLQLAAREKNFSGRLCSDVSWHLITFFSFLFAESFFFKQTSERGKKQYNVRTREFADEILNFIVSALSSSWLVMSGDFDFHEYLSSSHFD